MKLGLILVVVRLRGPCEPEMMWLEDGKQVQEEPRISRSLMLTPYEKRKIKNLRASSAQRILNFVEGESSKPRNARSLEDFIQGNDTFLIPNNIQKLLKKNEPLKQGQFYKRGQLLHFKFNMIYDRSVTQAQIFEFVNQRSTCVRSGGNACIIAYGQTGSGKTFTMEGGHTPETKGVIPRVLSELLANFKSKTSEESKVSKEEGIFIQALEVYLDNVNDLLDPSGSNCSKKAKIFCFKPSEWKITRERDIQELMERIKKNRKTSDNTFNKSSSRSHCFLKLYLREMRPIYQGDLIVSYQKRESLLTLVDLAGSEKWSDKKSKHASQQAAAINSSLSALTSVIQALPSLESEVSNVQVKAQRIPYKDSLLTYLLQDSMKPGACVSLIINVRPEIEHILETLSSLRFGNTASKCVV